MVRVLVRQVVPLAARARHVEHPVHRTTHVDLVSMGRPHFSFGNSGSTIAHCSSLKSLAYLACLFVRHWWLLLLGSIGCLVTSNSTFQEFLLFQTGSQISFVAPSRQLLDVASVST